MASATQVIPDQTKTVESKLKHWGAVFLRVIQSCLALAIAVFVGLYIGEKYASPLVPLAVTDEKVRYAFGTAAALSMVKEALGLSPKFWEYWKTGKGQNLWDISSFAFLTSLTLAVAFFLGITGKAGAGSAPPPTTQAVFDPIVFLQGGQHPTFMVPFSDEAEGCDMNSQKYKKGLNWFPGTGDFVNQLAKGLIRCSVPGRPVSIEIRGFASSTDFGSAAGAQCKNSDELNVGIANGRAQKVYDQMAGILKGASTPINMSLQRWGNIADMRNGAHFADRDANNQFDVLRGNLTRRADVVIASAGDCEPR